MRDLTADPAWQDEDLGAPLPDSLHACSVCLPTWDAVVGYESSREPGNIPAFNRAMIDVFGRSRVPSGIK